MKDIEQAILAEQEYIDKRANGKPSNIYAFIGKYGYTSVEKYNNDKQEYLAKKDGYRFFEVVSDFSTIANLMLSNKYKYLLYNIECAGEIAFVPKGFTQESKLMEYGIKPYVMWYESDDPDKSVIITGNGDLKVGLFYEREDICNFIIKKILEFTRRFYENVTLDRNDILIDGKKVIAFAHTSRDNKKVFYLNASFNDRSRVISMLCQNNGKEPYYIDRYTPWELLNEMKSWLL